MSVSLPFHRSAFSFLTDHHQTGGSPLFLPGFPLKNNLQDIDSANQHFS
jgi:hypothetical protein